MRKNNLKQFDNLYATGQMKTFALDMWPYLLV